MENDDKFLPNIFDHLETDYNDNKINLDKIEEIAYRVCASTALSLEESIIITKLFFTEVRNCVLRGDSVNLQNFGTFLLSNPISILKKGDTKKKVFPKFSASEELKAKLNDKQR